MIFYISESCTFTGILSVIFKAKVIRMQNKLLIIFIIFPFVSMSAEMIEFLPKASSEKEKPEKKEEKVIIRHESKKEIPVPELPKKKNTGGVTFTHPIQNGNTPLTGFQNPVQNRMDISKTYSDSLSEPFHGIAVKMDSSSDTAISTKTGKVMMVGYMDGYDNFVIVQHKEDVYSVYAHLDKIHVAEGQTISIGSGVGRVIPQKNLYFQISRGHKTFDPMQILKKKQD